MINVKYRVREGKQAKSIALDYLKGLELEKVINFGLPEVDDRYHIWRVPLMAKNKENVGQVIIDAITTLIDVPKTTEKNILEARLLGRKPPKPRQSIKSLPKMSSLKNTVGFGDCEELLFQTPNESVDLVFTSPPYYNARPEYTEYITYEEYLLKIRKIIQQCHRILNEGRFIVMNISHVLVKRSSRSEASKRIAVPFDMHRIFSEEGFEFIDDIIWVKPEGAGWATGRGRRFAADRNPLQYKAVPVTEYVLVYRKQTDKLIDWHIRNRPENEGIDDSKIADEYEKTNLWYITPSHSKEHPAIFPIELAEKVISYYSFKNDVVLDPFAGSGTTGKAAIKLGRRFVLFENNSDYIQLIDRGVKEWLMNKAEDVNWINYEPKKNEMLYLNL
jgi:DNA modification methylase